MRLITTQKPTISGIEVTCKGENKMVSQWLNRFLDDYHPVGYGTYVKESKSLDKENKSITVWRARSCD